MRGSMRRRIQGPAGTVPKDHSGHGGLDTFWTLASKGHAANGGNPGSPRFVGSLSSLGAAR
jgi:hypothetical protein